MRVRNLGLAFSCCKFENPCDFNERKKKKKIVREDGFRKVRVKIRNGINCYLVMREDVKRKRDAIFYIIRSFSKQM